MITRWLRGLIPTGTVTERAAKSGVWAAIINVADRVLQLGMVIVLGNLLDPADFGLYGIALLSLGLMRRVSELGLDDSLIQRTERNVDAYLNTLWTMKVLQGIAIVAIAYFAAPSVAAIFDEPRAAVVLRAVALSPLLIGIRNPRVMYLDKNLEFHKKFVYQFSGTLVQVGVAIGLALLSGTVWALVFGLLLGDVVRTISSYAIDPYVPVPAFDRGRAREMFGYGKWLTGSGLVSFLFSEGDDAFVGWFLGAPALGFYQMAYRLARAPSTEVTQVISSVMLPTYSEIQDDLVALRNAYFSVLKLTVLVSAPMALGIVAVAPTFVRAFLGTEWTVAIVPMQILAAWGLLLSIGSSSGPLFKARGRPDYITKVMILKTVLLAALIYPATARFGVAGTAGAVVCSALFTSEPIINYLAIKEIGGSFRQFFVIVGMPLVASVIMWGGVTALRSHLVRSADPVSFVLLVAAGGAIYVVCVLALNRLIGYGALDLLRTVRQAVS